MRKRLLLLMVTMLLVGLNGWSQSTQNRGSKASLETDFFYFDNPDGTIEAYPEYIYPDLNQRMMQISSSKYVLGDTNVEGLTPDMQYYTDFFFARRTRTTVFVFDGQASAQGALMTGATYAARSEEHTSELQSQC